jgi:hypothetical protein
MNELDEAWPELIDDAIARARATGRHDVADFLALKNSNDMIRAAAIKWLFDSMIEIASKAQADLPMLKIEREEPYTFSKREASLTGSKLELRLGVRCLTIEAGWTRKPGDGFMREGALAVAKISHFGMQRENVELKLLKGDAAPEWFIADQVFRAAALEQHFAIFLG